MALFIRNPYTILANTKALFAAPLFAENFAAITISAGERARPS